MRRVDAILEAIREHPDGITSAELGAIVYGDEGTRETRMFYANTKAHRLWRSGYVSKSRELRPDVRGYMVLTTIWRPL